MRSKYKKKRGVLSAPRYMYKLPMRIIHVELANLDIKQELPVFNELLVSTVTQNKPDYTNEWVCRNHCDAGNTTVVIATDKTTNNLGWIGESIEQRHTNKDNVAIAAESN